jgi:glycosyltransferase involved in cell wall biosynthesis
MWRISGLRKMKGLFPGKRLSANSLAEPPHLTSPYAAPDAMVAEPAKKLWAGFSRHAHRDLDALIHSARTREDRVFAAWELAKFHAAGAQWDQALHYLRIIGSLQKDFLCSREGGLLYIEALTSCGKAKEAEHRARRKLDKGRIGPDYYCALSNIMAARAARQRRIDESHRTRLALLNRLYKDNDLAEVGLADGYLGFAFGNLTAADAPLPAVHRAEKVSVLLTVHNAEQVLPVAVSSILSQTWRNVELIIVDDASTDGSWEVIGHLAREDSRVVAVRNTTDVGQYQSRNRALSLATGDFISVHDSNGWSHPQMLETQVQAMLSEPGMKLALPGTARVSLDMKYLLSLGEFGPGYVDASSRSSLMRMSDLQYLGKWDGVAANADEEFVQHAKAILGDQSVREVSPKAPISLRLNLSEGETDLRSITSGVRREYSRQAAFWRRSILLPARDAGEAVSVERVSIKQPFPVPPSLVPRQWIRNHHYDLVIISDLALLGGTRRCNEGYISAATSLGMKVGLLHWARYDLKLKDDIAKEYRLLSYGQNVDILTAEDHVSADLVLIHHPPIMKYLPDEIPVIRTKRVAILVNQLPGRSGESGHPYYQRNDVEADCVRLFGMAPVWIPISPLVRRVLAEAGFAPLAKEDWIPPLGGIVTVDRSAPSHRVRRRSHPVIGRHSRDHWTKWPEVESDLRGAYCADSKLPVRFLGGARYARKVLTTWPKNWQDFAFDSVTVSDFLGDLDFLVHFTHSAYVEEFGRNVMEAMAAGMPAVVPRHFREVFGDAVCYAEPERVEELISALWDSKDAYLKQVDKGFRFVREFASRERIERRLEEATQGDI